MKLSLWQEFHFGSLHEEWCKKGRPSSLPLHVFVRYYHSYIFIHLLIITASYPLNYILIVSGYAGRERKSFCAVYTGSMYILRTYVRTYGRHDIERGIARVGISFVFYQLHVLGCISIC